MTDLIKEQNKVLTSRNSSQFRTIGSLRKQCHDLKEQVRQLSERKTRGIASAILGDHSRTFLSVDIDDGTAETDHASKEVASKIQLPVIKK